MKFILLLFIITGAVYAESYRILSIFPFNGKSHNVMFSALVRGLAKRGHRVDDITHFPLKNPPKNYKAIVNLNGTLKSIVNSFHIEYVKSLSDDVVYFIAKDYGSDLCELMKLQDIQNIIQRPPTDPPYDLVITEAFGANCFMGFGHLFKVPVVAVSSSVEYPWVSDFIGNVDHPAFIPNALVQDFNKHKFWDRLKNLFVHHWNTYRFKVLTEKVQTDQIRKYLSPDMPNIRDVEKSVALTLVNSHPVIFGAKPVIPSLIEVAGLHIVGDDSNLSLEMQKWLDEGVDGVVYFTFGSLVLIETLPADALNAIYKSLLKLAPMRVIMKIADKSKLPPGLPANILISSWIPQQAVLAHKNVRAFITHGGMMGSQEALYFGVPMIGVPLFGDQSRNIATFAAKNIAIELDFNNITTVALDEALNKILKDPKYRENAQYYSKLFKDRPMSAMDTAIFWIEYVVRNGANALRSPAIDVPWWQLALLDLNAFIFVSIILLLTLTFYLIRSILKFCCLSTPKKRKTQ